MKIVIVAGGTGGHIYPGIAIAQELRRRDPASQILFLGSEEGMEKELVPQAGFEIKLIKARGLLRKISYKAISAPFVSVIGFFQALNILREFKPQALIATGGYASLPAVLAAKLLSIPIYLHEQNTLPGFTNRLYSRWASQVFLSFPETKKYLNGLVTGNPVRREILEADRGKARQSLGFSAQDKVVLILGGSQGARSINEAVIKALPLVNKEHVRIVHLIGHRDRVMIGTAKYSFYHGVEYLYNMAETIAAADLAISRAGATAISEFLAKGIPMVLVPFPYSAEGHQDVNARVVAESGAAIIIKDGELTPQKLAEVILNSSMDLIKMKANCQKLARPKAAEEIVNAIS